MQSDLDPYTPPPRLERISDYPSYYMAQTPNAEALSGAGGAYNYAQFSSPVDKAARAMIARGVCKGDVVATLSPPRSEFFILFLAAARIGAIWLGLNPRATQRELAHILEDASPALLFTIASFQNRDYLDELGALGVSGSRIISFGETGATNYDSFLAAGDSVSGEAFRAALEDVSEGDPALIVYTSGTTGAPKGALLSHGGIVRSFHMQHQMARLDNIRILNNLPINHIGSVGDVSCYALIDGGMIHFMEHFDPAGSLRAIDENTLTVWGQVPVQFRHSLDSDAFGRADLSSLRLIFWSGGVAPLGLVEELKALAPRLVNAYGMTEATSNVAYTPMGADSRTLSETAGKAAPDCEIKIAGDEGQDAPFGTEGEICVRCDHLMLGYLHREEATRETIDAEGWLRTGDVGTLSEDGYLRLTGRKKEMFKSGGYNVYPREIEQVLEAMPAVGAAVVVGAPHPVYGECGVAYVVARHGEVVDEAALRAHCQRNLANYKTPKVFRLKDALPMLAIGKTDKTALRKDAVNAFSNL